MGDTDDKIEPGVPEIFRLIQKDKDNLKENAVRELYDKITPLYDKGAEEASYYGPTKAVAVLNEYCPDKSVSILDCGAGTGIVGEKVNGVFHFIYHQQANVFVGVRFAFNQKLVFLTSNRTKGSVTMTLFTSGYKNVVGVDFSQKSVDFAAEKGVYKKLICADVVGQKMPFKDDEFGVLICCGCIAPGHISPKCFPEWIRIVKSGGYIIMVLRRGYVELQQCEEDMFSQSLGNSFEEEIRRLEDSKGWEVLLRQTFPGYLNQKGILSDGIAIACKVL